MPQTTLDTVPGTIPGYPFPLNIVAWFRGDLSREQRAMIEYAETLAGNRRMPQRVRLAALGRLWHFTRIEPAIAGRSLLAIMVEVAGQEPTMRTSVTNVVNDIVTREPAFAQEVLNEALNGLQEWAHGPRETRMDSSEGKLLQWLMRLVAQVVDQDAAMGRSAIHFLLGEALRREETGPIRVQAFQILARMLETAPSESMMAKLIRERMGRLARDEQDKGARMARMVLEDREQLKALRV